MTKKMSTSAFSQSKVKTIDLPSLSLPSQCYLEENCMEEILAVSDSEEEDDNNPCIYKHPKNLSVPFNTH
jgi:hypothetical protein